MQLSQLSLSISYLPSHFSLKLYSLYSNHPNYGTMSVLLRRFDTPELHRFSGLTLRRRHHFHQLAPPHCRHRLHPGWAPHTTELPQITLHRSNALLPHTTELPQITEVPLSNTLFPQTTEVPQISELPPTTELLQTDEESACRETVPVRFRTATGDIAVPDTVSLFESAAGMFK